MNRALHALGSSQSTTPVIPRAKLKILQVSAQIAGAHPYFPCCLYLQCMFWCVVFWEKLCLQLWMLLVLTEITSLVRDISQFLGIVYAHPA